MPLSNAALAILAEAAERTGGRGLVFPSPRGKVLSDESLSKLCKEHNFGGTPHGMRSSFRDWCAETGVSREVAERALGHAIKNPVEAGLLPVGFARPPSPGHGEMGRVFG